ncbi:hypothetical protein GGS23DRAFT_227024 [Durotheca rogersii]|uniref:uncharacterized protein n=1 Tax=Durotheca rogersii TaxID=419775 RepID=UPI00222090D9|nr:uncharacterized protein GGS23DRAFT_227024 [Durotheca rogersii]KAI5860514.1 hypothetical protein GGS23DRAFT_227024 [Durotheca rogersii]
MCVPISTASAPESRRRAGRSRCAVCARLLLDTGGAGLGGAEWAPGVMVPALYNEPRRRERGCPMTRRAIECGRTASSRAGGTKFNSRLTSRPALSCFCLSVALFALPLYRLLWSTGSLPWLSIILQSLTRISCVRGERGFQPLLLLLYESNVVQTDERVGELVRSTVTITKSERDEQVPKTPQNH